jgi:hypothetical protein
MWIVYAYKEGESEEFEDGSDHAFGPYDDEQNAGEDAASLADSGDWQARPLEVKRLPIYA